MMDYVNLFLAAAATAIVASVVWGASPQVAIGIGCSLLAFVALATAIHAVRIWVRDWRYRRY